MPNQIIFSLLIITILYGCNSSPEKKRSESVATEEIVNNQVNEIIEQESTANYIDESMEFEFDSSYVVTFKFKELTLGIMNFSIFDEDNKLAKTQKDTVSVYAELGETIEAQFISIKNNQLSDLKIEQRYETSVTIMAEGPHCDLTDWKHYVSDWKQLKKNKIGYFKCLEYTESEREKFFKIALGELKKEVNRSCGEGWENLLSKVKSPVEYPCGVSISRYFLKISGKNKNGQIITKMIIIEVPMGC